MFTGIITGMGQIAAVHPLGDTAAHGKRLETLAQGLALQFQDVDRLGPDLRVLARVMGRDAF